MRTRLQPGETVALIVRKHWIVLAKPALFFLAVLFSFPFRHVSLAGFEAILNYLFPYLLALSAGLLLYRCLDRKVNIWAVTSLRLIDEFGIVTHRSKENPLDKINDIVVEQTIAGRIFNYGSISVQTAATAGETVIEFVERPEDLKQTINAQKAMRAEREEGPAFPVREAPRGQSAPLPRTVLLHESVKPPFSLRCPHCGGEIIIDCAGTATSCMPSKPEGGAKERQDFADPEGLAPSLVSSHGTVRTSVIEETGPRASEQQIPADPFGWKRGAVKKSP
jgi:membrane protein YdbS with pleckstrin-like domain